MLRDDDYAHQSSHPLRKDHSDNKKERKSLSSDQLNGNFHQKHQPSLQTNITKPFANPESLTKQMLLKENRQKELVKGYKEIIWQQRTMDDSFAYDFDPFHFLDEE